jgi:hypothetical protein
MGRDRREGPWKGVRAKGKGRKEEKKEHGKGRGIWTPLMFQTDRRH